LSRARLRALAAYAAERNLPLDSDLVALVLRTLDELDALANSDAPSEPPLLEQRYRALAQLSASCRLALDWRSPALDQAGVLGVGSLESLGRDKVNYARYEQPGVDQLEAAVARQLTADGREWSVLMASSGMAALSVLLGTLAASRRLRRVLLTPTVYFEVREALELFSASVVMTSSCDAEEIADEAAGQQVDAVFADPLQNGPEQRLIDVAALVRRLGDVAPQASVIVDGTTAPLPQTFASLEAAAERTFYYESLSKYRHLGLDLTLAGVAVVPRTYAPLARRARQNLGAVLDRYGVELSPLATTAQLTERFRLMEQAAFTVASEIAVHAPPGWSIHYPGLPGHPDHALSLRLRLSGACVTLTPIGLDGRRRATALTARAMDLARRGGGSLIFGESFGFTTSRLATTLAESNLPPVVRLAVGPVAPDAAVRLGQIIAEAATDS
jgi:cystathionine beta-lyase/cystathionine gamma-synthase